MTIAKIREFLLPETLDEALALKAQWLERARFVAGGTDLVLQVHAGRHQPEAVIRLPVVAAEPMVEGGRLTIPALTPLSTLERHPLMVEHVPLLAEAIAQIGSPQIRYAGTLGGNLGNASPAADSAPPLLVYDADIVLANTSGQRTVKATEFFLGPGKTVLADDEAVVAVQVDVTGGTEVGFFRKFGPRGANVISSASFAARVLVYEGKIEAAYLAAGSVAPRPVRLPVTEQTLTGMDRRDFLSAQTVTQLTDTLQSEVSPISDVRGSDWYKSQVVERCLQVLCELLQPQRG